MKSLSKITVVGLAVAALITLSSMINPAVAQRADRGPDQEQQKRHLTLLKDKLDLSDGQVNEINAIMEQARLEAQKAREERKGDREEARKVRETKRAEIDDKIKSVLNDKQKKEFDKVKDELRQRRESRDRDGKRGMRDGSGQRDGSGKRGARRGNR